MRAEKGLDPLLPPRPHPEPAGDDQGAERRVANHEDPGWRLVVEHRFDPVRDESARVG